MLINGDRYHRALHPILAVTFCDICMPEAFREIETLVERFCQICEFCERKTSPECCLCVISYEWVRSISHRITQMNRTHKVSQRH